MTDTRPALDLAMRRLKRRSLSRAELLAALARDGVEPAEADAAAADLARRGFVNDAELAASIARRFAREGRGKDAARAELQVRAIDDAIANVALAAADWASALGAAIAYARRRLTLMPSGLADGARRQRLLASLARRGFDEDTCRGVLAELERAGLMVPGSAEDE